MYHKCLVLVRYRNAIKISPFAEVNKSDSFLNPYKVSKLNVIVFFMQLFESKNYGWVNIQKV